MTNNEEKLIRLNEAIQKSIKELPLRDKLKSVALHHYLEMKKKMDIELEEEIRALKKKYEKQAQPLYQKSCELIEGLRIPAEEELADVDTYLKEEEVSVKINSLTMEPIRYFWFKALKHSDFIAQEIKEKDELIMVYLTKIEYILIEHSENFSIQFHFSPNEYFNNLVLKKTFILKGIAFIHQRIPLDGQNPIKSDATNIEWKENKNITKKNVKKKNRGEKESTVEAESFFNFFKPINLEDEEWLESQTKEERDKIADRMDKDYDIGKMIKDEIIPYSLEYFLSVRINDEYDDIEDLDSQQSYEDLDEEEEEEDQNKQKKKITTLFENKTPSAPPGK